jgi:hypothetical protein
MLPYFARLSAPTKRVPPCDALRSDRRFKIRRASALTLFLFKHLRLWSLICTAQDGVEVKYDDHIGYSSGVVFAWWRRLGIFSLARLGPLPL